MAKYISCPLKLPWIFILTPKLKLVPIIPFNTSLNVCIERLSHNLSFKQRMCFYKRFDTKNVTKKWLAHKQKKKRFFSFLKLCISITKTKQKTPSTKNIITSSPVKATTATKFTTIIFYYIHLITTIHPLFRINHQHQTHHSSLHSHSITSKANIKESLPLRNRCFWW